MFKKTLSTGLLFLLLCSLAACGATEQQQDIGATDTSENSSYESVEGTKIKMITENTEVVITLNDSRAAADLVAMLPLEMTLIERNSFAKGMTMPEHISSVEATTREYEIGDFGYLVELFTGIGVDMYFDGVVSAEKIKEIDIATLLSLDEVTGIMKECLRQKQ